VAPNRIAKFCLAEPNSFCPKLVGVNAAILNHSNKQNNIKRTRVYIFQGNQTTDDVVVGKWESSQDNSFTLQPIK